MTFWLLLIVIALVVAGVCAALLRQPGVVLYDWLASPPSKPAPAVNTPLTNKGHEPATLAG